jgi:hypothetical protein
MKLALLLYQWWQADNMARYKYRIKRSKKKEGLRKKNYCSRIYANTKSPQRHNTHTKSWMHIYVAIQAMCAT